MSVISEKYQVLVLRLWKLQAGIVVFGCAVYNLHAHSRFYNSIQKYGDARMLSLEKKETKSYTVLRES